MKSAFIFLITFIVRLLLKIRYRVEYKGLDVVLNTFKDSSNGVLFLANHPAVVVDPLIVFVALQKPFAIRPLIVEFMYYHPLFHPFVRAISALPIPDFSTGMHSIKLSRAKKTLKMIAQELKTGQNFLLYPAGTTKHTAKEVLGGSFGVHAILSENPEAQVVLVRTTGLWGSSFSRAATGGARVHLKEVFPKCFWTVIKNALFFVPKRKVEVVFEIAKADFPRSASKQELNAYLEEWYNKPFRDNKEPLNLVSYSFFKKDFLKIQKQESEKIDISAVSEQIKEKVVKKVAQIAKRPENQVLAELNLFEHLGLDSLDFAELVAFLEEEFDVVGITPEDLTTVSRLFLIASKLYVKEVSPEVIKKSRSWNRKREAHQLQIGDAKTIPEAFFAACKKAPFSAICSDALSGTMSYFEMKRAVLLLSEKIRKLPGKRVGVLLPASCASMIVVLACQVAGKVPVIINWTVGGRHLEAVVSLAGISCVLSSWKFLDKLENVDLQAIDDMIVLLEELKADIGLFTFLQKSLLTFFDYSVELKEGDEAVCLFTSGTEGMPKGVPLTHRNILSNQQAILEDVALFSSDILLSCLPPFHSFGFSVTGLLPLLCGLRVVFYPNPTDSKRLAKVIDTWEISILCSAPTFLKNILYLANKSELKSVRLIVSGAEKAPQELFSLREKQCPNAVFYEGYGITECAPVLTVNTTGNKESGVGRPLHNVQVLIVDPEHLDKEKNQGEEGLVLARGPNVFSGYLRVSDKESTAPPRNPFIEVAGVIWYQTGDLGFISEDGNLIISGRLKRFVKIGAEMLSLAAIEEALCLCYESSILPQFVVMPKMDPLGKEELVLFTTKPLDPVQVTQMLRKAGLRNIVKISLVIQVDEIPLTATGKVAFRELEALTI